MEEVGQSPRSSLALSRKMFNGEATSASSVASTEIPESGHQLLLCQARHKDDQLSAWDSGSGCVSFVKAMGECVWGHRGSKGNQNSISNKYSTCQQSKCIESTQVNKL